MNAPVTPNRVIVSDFDSVRQAFLWRRHGPDIGRERMVVALRVSLLVADDLLVDRNQLLDGIGFLALGPDGVASALGLEQGEPLPITVRCGDSPARDASEDLVPLLRGVDPDDPLRVCVRGQLDAVRSADFRSASSALLAAHMTKEGDTLFGPASPSAWRQGAGLSYFHHQPASRDDVLAEIEQAQDRWAAAMRQGRVAVDRWDRPGTPTLEVHDALQRARHHLESASGRPLRPLADFVLSLETPRRITAVAEAHEWAQRHPDSVECQEMSYALEMWSRAYYDAIARQSDSVPLTFFDPIEDTALAQSYGLVLPPRSPWKRVQDRLRARNRLATTAAVVRVEGDVLDRMSRISPATYAETHAAVRALTRGTSPEESSKMMLDIADVVRSMTPEPVVQTHAQRRRGVWARATFMALLTVVASLVALFKDLQELPTGLKIALTLTAAVAALLASLPWGDLTELVRTRPRAMTATLGLRTERDR